MMAVHTKTRSRHMRHTWDKTIRCCFSQQECRNGTCRTLVTERMALMMPCNGDSRLITGVCTSRCCTSCKKLDKRMARYEPSCHAKLRTVWQRTIGMHTTTPCSRGAHCIEGLPRLLLLARGQPPASWSTYFSRAYREDSNIWVQSGYSANTHVRTSESSPSQEALAHPYPSANSLRRECIHCSSILLTFCAAFCTTLEWTS